MSGFQRIAVTMVLSVSAGACSDGPLQITQLQVGEAPGAGPSYEEFWAAAKPVGDFGYLVERDILVGDADQVATFYEETYLDHPGKSIIDFTSAGLINKRTGPVIGYCVDSSWGTALPCDFNGDGDTTDPGEFSNPSNASLTTLEAGMAQWEAVANIDFVRRFPASCSGGAAQPSDVSFRIQHYCDIASPPNGLPTGIAFGSFPDSGGPSWAAQVLGVPSAGVNNVNFAAHEIGHILGFRHEHIHSGNNDFTPAPAPNDAQFCFEDNDGSVTDGDFHVDGVDFDELTAFDTNSVMKYSDCRNGQGVSLLPVSPLDAMGARMIYGPPAFWSPGLTATLFFRSSLPLLGGAL